MGKSYSYSEAKDQRLAIEGAVGQVTAPESQIANTLGIALQDSSGAKISYGDVTITDLDAVNSLVNAILASQEETLDTVTTTTSALVTEYGSTSKTLVDTLEAIKTPLAKYLPYAVLALIFFLIMKYGRP